MIPEPELDSQVYLSVQLQMRFMKKKIEKKIKIVGVTKGWLVVNYHFWSRLPRTKSDFQNYKWKENLIFFEEMDAELDSKFHYVRNKTKTGSILIYFLKPEPAVLHISQELPNVGTC